MWGNSNSANPPTPRGAPAPRDSLRQFGSDTARLIPYELDGTGHAPRQRKHGGRPRAGRQHRDGYPPAGLTATLLHTGQAARVMTDQLKVGPRSALTECGEGWVGDGSDNAGRPYKRAVSARYRGFGATGNEFRLVVL